MTKIKELKIRKHDCVGIEIAWTLSAGSQTAYELFLIREGCVVDCVKTESNVTQCTLRIEPEPLKEYFLLLTVTAGSHLSSARAGFRIDKGSQLYLCVVY